MKTVGLTGGISTGKSTVAAVFEELGIAVFYSDFIARELMITQPGIISSLKKHFGDAVYNQDQSLNKALLSKLIFENINARQTINSIVHPYVWKAFKTWSDEAISPYVIMESALLFQSGFYKMLDSIIVIESELELRKQRLAKRDSISITEAEKRITSQDFQIPSGSKYDTIKNSNELVLPQIIKIHEQKISNV
jgi:dephospho-CoA kinase